MAFSQTLVRNFSVSTAFRQLKRPPIQVFGIEGRYATALYSAASKENQLDKVEAELKQVQNYLKDDVKFRSFVYDPSRNRVDKGAVFEATFKKLGFSAVSINFFAAIAENGRSAKMSSIIKTFEKLMSAHRGEVLCEIITAKPLDAVTSKEVTSSLQAFAKSGEKLCVETKVDPSIIGGMIVSVGDKYVDMSIATKLNQLEHALKTAI